MHAQDERVASRRPYALEQLGRRVFTCEAEAWPGLTINAWDCDADEARTDFFLGQTTIFLRTAGYVDLRARSDGTLHRHRLGRGTLSIVNRTTRFDSMAWAGRFRVLTVEIDPSPVMQLFGPDARPPERPLVTEFAIDDGQLASLLRHMAAETRAGCPGGRMYGEYLSLALISYLCQRYSLCGCDGRPGKAVLSAAQLRQVEELVQGDIAGDLSLSALAEAVHLSAYHFTRLFKNTLGVPPHQYVTQKRVERARLLLDSTAISIANVALAVGFSNQSHFTTVFRKVTGTTPRLYKQSH